MKTRFLSTFAFALGAIIISGCGGGTKLHPVEGVITVDGQPVEGCMVTFTMDSVNSSGITSASGKFKLLTAGKEGAPAGTFKVTVSKTPPIPLPPGGTGDASGNATEMYAKMLKDKGAKQTDKGIVIPKAKSEIPERYNKAGSIPDQVVPASGPITIELKSK
jgi:hypothetical protein